MHLQIWLEFSMSYWWFQPPLKNHESIWESSPNRVENKKYLKPPPSHVRISEGEKKSRSQESEKNKISKAISQIADITGSIRLGLSAV